MAVDIKSITISVCELARETGRFIREESRHFEIDKAIAKGMHDYVSYVDLESEKMITKRLSGLLPGSGFLTEEGTVINREEKYTWIIDPLDGTTNYVHGLAPYSVSIALKNEGETVMGVVYNITADEMFYATAGGGAWLNGKRISVSGTTLLDDSLVSTGFPFRNYSRLDGFLKCLEYFIRNTHGVRRMGSAAIDLAYVACGRFDAFYEYNLNPWDVSAGVLLVREAGGRVSDFSGIENEISGEETVAANSLLFNEFREIVEKNMK